LKKKRKKKKKKEKKEKEKTLVIEGFPMDGELMGAGSNNPNMYLSVAAFLNAGT